MLEIAAYLWLCAIGDNAGRYCDIHLMANMEVCQEAVKSARINMPNGGDMQTGVVIFCTNNRDLYWATNGSWMGKAAEKQP